GVGSRRRSERGTALVEFALVLPFLAVLVFGTIDIGRAYQLENRLKNAAREGGRMAQVSPAQVDNSGTACADPNNIVYAATHEEAAAAGNYTVTVTRLDTNAVLTGCSTAALPGGTHVQVKVSAPFKVLTPLVGIVTGSSMTVSGTQEVVVQG
ncbi:MAG: pilus assembly protein, partial [Acidimicrobiia bacterium]|nr:pilus assembly protein [Acidimicrobiia bacterium]